MKRIIFIAFALLVCHAAYSQESGDSAGQSAAGTKNFEDARALLEDNGLNSNFDEISTLAAVLPVQERIALYNEFAFPMWKRIACPMLNLVGFGIGSFIQGDTMWGGISLTLDCVGVAAESAGIVMFYVTGLSLIPTLLSMGQMYNPFLTEASFRWTIGLLIGGMALSGASRIASGIRSLVYPSQYDSRLKHALQLDGVEMDIEPALIPSSQGIGLALVRFSF